MSRFVGDDVSNRIDLLIRSVIPDNPVGQFLHNEIVRYIPQFAGMSDDQVINFLEYQKFIYIGGCLPVIGKPIASLNPTFIDSVDVVHFSRTGHSVYTRASVKENGYRMQFHISKSENIAYTRQFTRYDLRMFPELKETFENLPLMIGDAELVNLDHKHLAGFNRVQARIPNQSYWPKSGATDLDDSFLELYLSNTDLFKDKFPIQDMKMTLVLHGIYAIAHPSTWYKSREVQMNSIISLCKLPIDYERVDSVLSSLQEFMIDNNLNARVVERQVVNSRNELRAYVNKNERSGFEGTCIVQSVKNTNGEMVVGPKSVKIKKYETLDCVLLGLYLRKKDDGLFADNIIGALVGLYDQPLGVYLPAAKVNLDPEGVQIKTEGQKSRLCKLRSDIVFALQGKDEGKGQIYTLLDTFNMQGGFLLKSLFKELVSFTYEALNNLPRGQDIFSLFQRYEQEKESFLDWTKKKKTAVEEYILENITLFRLIESLDNTGKKRFFEYFSKFKDLKVVSQKLVKPQFVVDTKVPIILETLVFDIKWGTSPNPAGFHTWYGNSFCFSNCFAERIRYDKSTTTDYKTVYELARAYTVRKSRK